MLSLSSLGFWLLPCHSRWFNIHPNFSVFKKDSHSNMWLNLKDNDLPVSLLPSLSSFPSETVWIVRADKTKSSQASGTSDS